MTEAAAIDARAIDAHAIDAYAGVAGGRGRVGDVARPGGGRRRRGRRPRLAPSRRPGPAGRGRRRRAGRDVGRPGPGPRASRCWWPAGATSPSRLVREHHPDAILLDTSLPGIDGLALLEELKRQIPTRHIPVHIISGADNRQSALSAGALSFLQKPVSPDDLNRAVAELMGFIETATRRVLVVEDDERERASIIELVGSDHEGIEVVGVGSSEEALAALEEQHFDCMVLDLKLPRTSGFALLERLKADERFSARCR